MLFQKPLSYHITPHPLLTVMRFTLQQPQNNIVISKPIKDIPVISPSPLATSGKNQQSKRCFLCNSQFGFFFFGSNHGVFFLSSGPETRNRRRWMWWRKQRRWWWREFRGGSDSERSVITVQRTKEAKERERMHCKRTY
jgi:hypothetical protein